MATNPTPPADDVPPDDTVATPGTPPPAGTDAATDPENEIGNGTSPPP